MRNLRRRIEALEKSWTAKRAAHRKIPGQALFHLERQDMESIINAYAADRAGRPLTERESAGRQAYRESLERESRSAGFHSAGGFEPIPDIHRTIFEAVCASFDKNQFDLLVIAVNGKELEGRPPTEQEAVVLELYYSEMERLCQLAGFGSIAELRI